MRSRAPWLAAAAAAVAILAWAGYRRSGLLDLPPVPAGLTAAEAGVAGLAAASGPAAGDPETLARRFARRPDDLLLGNDLRMAWLRRKRDYLESAAVRGERVVRLPPALDSQPAALVRHLLARQPSRELTLQLALAHLDGMLLAPALEVQAAASMEAKALLDGLLAEHPYYLPALYARGTIFLYRPLGLRRSPVYDLAADAASRDLALCVAIGRRVGPADPQVAAELALSLGDAYAKEGRLARARSWWQIAAALGERVDRRVAVRLAWRDAQLPAVLEAELERGLRDLARPMSDMRRLLGTAPAPAAEDAR